MMTKKVWSVLVAFSFGVTILFILFIRSPTHVLNIDINNFIEFESWTSQNSSNSSSSSQVFLVDTTNCKIPDLNPLDPSLKGVVKSGSHITCTKYKPLTKQDGDILIVDHAAIKNSQHAGKFSYCTYKPITRPYTNNTDHNVLGYLNASKKFNESIKVSPSHEHLFVQCFDSNGVELFVNFHTFIFDKPEVEKRCNNNLKRRKEAGKSKETLSILIVVIDSVSRLNAMRFMPKTVKYLMETMDAVDMAGFNKVGYGTFHNMIPALTGKFYEELPWSFEKPEIFDKYNFIWEDYVKEGYKTYYAEDYPFGALFDYKKPGFRASPADYYNRHLFLSMYQAKQKFVYSEENCILHKQQTMWVLDPAYDFLQKYKSSPYFCFLLITRLTHDYLERTAGADPIYYDYFKKLNENNLLNNTALFVMADHGMRFGDIRKWYIGLLEERLPMLYVTFPKWFRDKYPEHMKNMRINANRLTTHFDLHQTWKDLLNFEGVTRTGSLSQRAMSFFDSMPESRGCKEAKVDPHWCTCTKLESINPSDKYVSGASKFFIDSINSNLKPVHDVCEILSIAKINSAYKIRAASSDLDKVLLSYKISILAHPGGGVFEGTITYDMRKKFYKMSSEIDRINAYGGEKRCGVDYLQERLCYCKSNKVS